MPQRRTAATVSLPTSASNEALNVVAARPSRPYLARQFVFERHFAQALDAAGGGAAGRHELAGDHAAGGDNHALLQRLAVFAELVGEPGQRIVAVAEHVAGMTAAHDLAVEGDRAVEVAEIEVAPPLVGPGEQRAAIPADVHHQPGHAQPAVVGTAVVDQLEAGARLTDVRRNRVLVVRLVLRPRYIGVGGEDDLELNAKPRPLVGAHRGLVFEHALLADRSVGRTAQPGLLPDLRRGERDLVTNERPLLGDELVKQSVLHFVGRALILERKLLGPPTDDGPRAVDLMQPVGGLGDTEGHEFLPLLELSRPA